MPLYKAKVAGTYKDINFAIGDVIDVAEADVAGIGFDKTENAEAYVEPVAPIAPEPAAEAAGEGVSATA